jgi:hypothetical protein
VIDRQLNTGPRLATWCTAAASGVPCSDVGTNGSAKPSSAASMEASMAASCCCAAIIARTPLRCSSGARASGVVSVNTQSSSLSSLSEWPSRDTVPTAAARVPCTHKRTQPQSVAAPAQTLPRHPARPTYHACGELDAGAIQ